LDNKNFIKKILNLKIKLEKLIMIVFLLKCLILKML